jgi:hypothetical protein
MEHMGVVFSGIPPKNHPISGVLPGRFRRIVQDAKEQLEGAIDRMYGKKLGEPSRRLEFPHPGCEYVSLDTGHIGTVGCSLFFLMVVHPMFDWISNNSSIN